MHAKEEGSIHSARGSKSCQVILRQLARCRSPHQILVMGSHYLIAILVRGGLFFEKINTEMVRGATLRRP